MYCVQCGVRLQDGRESCPLCGTPVWNPAGVQAEPVFPDRYPDDTLSLKKKWAILLTAFMVIMGVTELIVWLNVGRGIWGGIAMLGTLLAYIIFVLPLWFKKMYAYIWLPIIHVATAPYLLYICSVTGGSWFWPFAFPLTMIHALLITAASVLLHYLRRGRCYILGGTVIAYGLVTLLVEFFGHITFGLRMFVWSLYSASVLVAAGLFLILVGIIKPMKRYLQRLLFF